MIYSGSCQCGKVTFEADTEIKQVLSCNCSRCRRLGALLSAVPAEKFALKSGADALTEFQFNKHVIHHMFCATCGVQPFARGKGPGGADMVMINVRCVDGIDAETLPVQKFDGRSL
jgi:hypothetical protein